MDDAYSISSEFLTVVLYWSRYFSLALKHSQSLTIPQFRTLNHLYVSDTEPGATELARALNLSPGTITFIVKRLEARGYVSRTEDTKTHSVIRIGLTTAGREAIVSARTLATSVADTMREPLGDFLKGASLKGAIPYDDEPRFMARYMNELGQATLYSSLLFENKVEEILAEYEIGVAEYRVLFELLEHPDGIKPTELAMALLLKLADVSGACRKLLDKGWILRSRNGCDQRTVTIEITSDGYAVVNEIARYIEEMNRETFVDHSPETRYFQNKASRIMVAAQRRRFRYC